MQKFRATSSDTLQKFDSIGIMLAVLDETVLLMVLFS